MRRVPEWNAAVLEVRDATSPTAVTGSRYTAVMEVGGRRVEARWTVTQAQPPRLLEISGPAPGGGSARLTNRWEPSNGGTAASVEVAYDLPGGVLGRLANRLVVQQAVESEVRRSAESFRALAEAEAARTR